MTYKPNKISQGWYVSDDHISIAFPSLVLQPLTYSTADIVKCFVLGKPLSPDQINYLDWHRGELSNVKFEPILKYYLKPPKDSDHDFYSSILLPHEIMNRETVTLLKKRIDTMIKESKSKSVDVNLSHKEFLELRRYSIQDLIFWRGNQFLTGAPFYPGSVPSVIHFQWGNYFGIIKQGFIAGEKSGTGNLLLHFEKMKERTLEQCVLDYQKHEHEQIKFRQKLDLENNRNNNATNNLKPSVKL